MAHETISERVRDVGDGIILAFPIEKTEVAGNNQLQTTRLYFFRVASETRYFQKYTSLSSISSGSTSPTNGYDYLGDTGVGSGDDIFRISTDDWHLMHFGFATAHPDLEVFKAVSPNANGDPAQDRTGQGEDIVPGTDDRGWYSQKQIADQFDPPAFTERVSFRNDKDGEFLLWAFHNDGGSALSGSQLDLYFTGRGYKLQPVTDPEVQDLMLREAMMQRRDPEIDTILHQVGGVNEYTLGSEEPDDWGETNGLSRTFNVTEFEPELDGDDGGETQSQRTSTRVTPSQ